MISLNLRIILAIVLSLGLSILPLPELITNFRPPWVLMLVLYLQFFIPSHFNLMVLIIIGLMMDVLLATVMGEHALALILVTWIASSKARRFQFFSPGQQMALIGFFCFLYQLAILVTDSFLGYPVSWLSCLSSSLVSVVFWLWIRLLADDSLKFKT